jgi:hypothetical protein
MGRLEKLAKEKEGYVGHMSPILPTNFVIPERYQEFIEYENTILNWLDGQIRQSVAQEIFKQLEERCPHTPDDAFAWIKRMCPGCFHAIKSKWGIRDE